MPRNRSTWLKGQPDDIVEAAAKVAESVQLQDGYRLLHHGDKSLAFNGVVAGAERFIRVNDVEKEMISDVAAPGSFLGEISLLDD